jgi:polyisoprenoid-binding protein YceI
VGKAVARRAPALRPSLERNSMTRHPILVAALLLASVPLHATTYTIEPRHTQGVLRWNHIGFSNPTAQFSLVEGKLEFDQSDPTHSTVAVTIPLANLNTGVPELNEYLREPDFFDLAKYPTATFTSTKVQKGCASNLLKVSGDFNLHGVTRPVVLDVTINKVGADPRDNVPVAGFEATTTVKRSDFGLGLYVALVSDEIRIHITCQAIEAKAYAQRLQKEAASAASEAAEKAAAANAAKK